jgi:hypothetical protein
MSLQHYYDSVCRGDWANVNPSLCGCRGRGWFLSDLDTYHECPIHYIGQAHPEGPEWAMTTLTGWQVAQDPQFICWVGFRSFADAAIWARFETLTNETTMRIRRAKYGSPRSKNRPLLLCK